MTGLTIILVFTGLGVLIGKFTGFPGALAGLILLALALFTGIVKEETVSKCGDFFLRHLTLFFLPAALGIVDHFGLLSRNLLPVLLVISVSTALTILVTGWVAELAGGGSSER